LASDEFEGRSTFSEGLGLAAAHIASQLKSWGVRPGGPNGSYFQRVAVVGVKSTNRSTVTVEAQGQTRTFKDGEALKSYLPGRRIEQRIKEHLERCVRLPPILRHEAEQDGALHYSRSNPINSQPSTSSQPEARFTCLSASFKSSTATSTALSRSSDPC
jgi:hypothetical protein